MIVAALAIGAGLPELVEALGEGTDIDIRSVTVQGATPPHPTTTARLAWEVRQRTSVETRLTPTASALDDPSIFETPLLYWSGNRGFAPLSEGELTGLRRFVEFGGFVIIDDASVSDDGFDASVRRAIGRAFGHGALTKLPPTHTVYRSFYLLDRPVGRIRGPEYLEAVERGGRAAIIYSRHDMGGAWERDNLGTWRNEVVPGGERQREDAYRLGVNLVLYALCLDYKDDQVHAPFIMRRATRQR